MNREELEKEFSAMEEKALYANFISIYNILVDINEMIDVILKNTKTGDVITAYPFKCFANVLANDGHRTVMQDVVDALQNNEELSTTMYNFITSCEGYIELYEKNGTDPLNEYPDGVIAVTQKWMMMDEPTSRNAIMNDGKILKDEFLKMRIELEDIYRNERYNIIAFDSNAHTTADRYYDEEEDDNEEFFE